MWDIFQTSAQRSIGPFQPIAADYGGGRGRRRIEREGSKVARRAKETVNTPDPHGPPHTFISVN